jgi:hypothetical protein
LGGNGFPPLATFGKKPVITPETSALPALRYAPTSEQNSLPVLDVKGNAEILGFAF